MMFPRMVFMIIMFITRYLKILRSQLNKNKNKLHLPITTNNNLLRCNNGF